MLHPDDLPQIEHLRMPPPTRDVDVSLIEEADAYELEQGRKVLVGAPDDLVRYYLHVLNGSVLHELSVLRALGLPSPTAWSAEAFPELGASQPASLLATASIGEARLVRSWNWLPEHPEYEEELRVLASDGRLTLTMAKPYLLEDRSLLRVERHELSERRSTDYTQLHETGFLRQLDAFAESIRTGAPVVSDIAGAAADIATLQSLAAAIGARRGIDVSTEASTRTDWTCPTGLTRL